MMSISVAGGSDTNLCSPEPLFDPSERSEPLRADGRAGRRPAAPLGPHPPVTSGPHDASRDGREPRPVEGRA